MPTRIEKADWRCSSAGLGCPFGPSGMRRRDDYGRFYRSALHAVFDTLDQYLVRWVRRKYKRLKFKGSRARDLVVTIRHQRPTLFAHWALAQDGGR